MRLPFRYISILAGVLGCAASCAGDDAEVLHCRDLAPASEATFSAVSAIVTGSSRKSCAPCHNTETPLWGLNFEGPAVAYDALTTKMHLIYPQVATGAMPEVGEAWSLADLRLLRSWYCRGGFYED